MPAGSLSNWNAAFATSWMPIARSVPAMVKRPPSNSMSSSDASRRCATLALGDNLVADRDDGAPAHGGRARAAGAHAERHRVGVPGDELDPVGIDAQPINEHLGLDRGMALAV